MDINNSIQHVMLRNLPVVSEFLLVHSAVLEITGRMLAPRKALRYTLQPVYELHV